MYGNLFASDYLEFSKSVAIFIVVQYWKMNLSYGTLANTNPIKIEEMS